MSYATAQGAIGQYMFQATWNYVYQAVQNIEHYCQDRQNEGGTWIWYSMSRVPDWDSK